MPKINIKQTDPVHYATVKAEQEEIKKKCAGQMQIARLCPYCGHKVTVLVKGNHGYSKERCNNCGEEVVFPPIVFRMSQHV